MAYVVCFSTTNVVEFFTAKVMFMHNICLNCLLLVQNDRGLYNTNLWSFTWNGLGATFLHS